MIYLKFIFPQNYNFKPKIFGVIDYSVAILDLIWSLFIIIFLNFFLSHLSQKIFVGIILIFPVFLFSFTGVQGESLIYFLLYMLKFALKQKVFLYNKFNIKT